ncbi:MAG: glucose-6-phosphate dehydrogenase [Pseudomonadota bacterium]|nr:glucose-6-phosphate dehydrogenase [Pseudomonadota bacterium]
MVIFGAGGDLAKRLLIPALYNLSDAGLLAKDFKILGVDHSPGDDARFRKDLGGFLKDLATNPLSEFGLAKIDAKAWGWLAERMFYQVGDFEDDASYAALGKRLETLGGAGGGDVLFYLAVAPRFFGDIVERLHKAGLTRAPRGAFRRVVIEKPFGDDLDSAKALNRRITKCLDEKQIYRIDHFLGKETVRNIMVTRFGNGVFEPLWNRQHIDSIQITAAETVGVEGRGAFYDRTGALRDMVPNHLFQLLTMIAMEPPNSFDAEAVRAEKGRVIEAIRHQTPTQALADSVRGQYRGGTVAGRKVIAYRDAPNVNRQSRTETFIALKLGIDNWRWAGVPFYLRTGKAMSAHDTQIAIQFKAAPKTLFQDVAEGKSTPNVLLLRIQPNEGISLLFDAKRPGPDVCLTDVKMDFSYADWFQHKPATGYETLIYDCLIGDQTLFKRADDIENAWRAVMPFLDAWKSAGEVHGYSAGTDGPAEARTLLTRDGRQWRTLV